MAYRRAKSRFRRGCFMVSADELHLPAHLFTLGIPAKVHIPERYNPAQDEDSELEFETEEQRARREAKVQKMAKIITSQSLQEWHPREILPEWNGSGPPVNDMKQRLEREKELRQEVLVKRRALAQEVSEQTKILAGTPEFSDEGPSGDEFRLGQTKYGRHFSSDEAPV
ncbi:uncharacterized protein [Diadema antillarum]|uniref:uncharacterized protein isoform X1 n=1 Tax=Diadema antillarum TaxID=105358 RepID=UPI003A8B7120